MDPTLDADVFELLDLGDAKEETKQGNWWPMTYVDSVWGLGSNPNYE